MSIPTSFTLRIDHVYTPAAAESRADGAATTGTTVKERYKMFWHNPDAAWMATSWLGMILVDSTLVVISIGYGMSEPPNARLRCALKTFLHLHFWFGWFVVGLHGSILLWPVTARKGPAGLFTCGALLWEGSLVFIGALRDVVCVRNMSHRTMTSNDVATWATIMSVFIAITTVIGAADYLEST